MRCENCNNEHAGTYASGRFCCVKCSRSYSSNLKRDEINRKVSETNKLKGKSQTSHLRTPEVLEKRKKTMIERYGAVDGWFNDNQRKVARAKAAERRRENFLKTPFEELSIHTKRRVLIKESSNTCSSCKNTTWLGQPIVLEMDHIDGNKQNNSKENLRILCPNCHSLTNTWKGRNKPSCRSNILGSVAQSAGTDPS